RVEQDGPRVEAVPATRRERAVDPVAVQHAGRQVVDEDVPDVAGAVAGGIERDLGEGVFSALVKEDQLDTPRVPGGDGEVDPGGPDGHAERPAVAARRGQRP